MMEMGRTMERGQILFILIRRWTSAEDIDHNMSCSVQGDSGSRVDREQNKDTKLFFSIVD